MSGRFAGKYIKTSGSTSNYLNKRLHKKESDKPYKKEYIPGLKNCVRGPVGIDMKDFIIDTNSYDISGQRLSEISGLSISSIYKYSHGISTMPIDVFNTFIDMLHKYIEKLQKYENELIERRRKFNNE